MVGLLRLLGDPSNFFKLELLILRSLLGERLPAMKPVELMTDLPANNFELGPV